MMRYFFIAVMAAALCLGGIPVDTGHAATKQTASKSQVKKKRVTKRPAKRPIKKVNAPKANDNRAYGECTALASKSPGEALKTTEQALKQKKSAPMRHCRAMALFSLKRYPEASVELEALAKTVGPQQASLWLNVMRQAATARELAHEMSKALDNLTKAIDFAQDKDMDDQLVEMLPERARLSRALNTPLDAVQDLDHALSISPTDGKALALRAETFLELKQYDLARRDVEALLKAEPENAEARALLGRVVGKGG